MGADVFSVRLLALCFISFATMAQEHPVETQVLKNINDFSNSLYQILSNENKKSVFFSPISIYAVLSMVSQGAAGSTRKSLCSALKIDDPKSVLQGYKSLLTRLSSTSNLQVILSLANKLFLHQNFSLLKDFKSKLVENFQSDVQLVDFEQNEDVAKTINQWVLEQTQGKITNLISSEDLNARTRLVLVNAIYFKGNWLQKFDPKNTRNEPFHLTDRDSVLVPMMHMKSKFRCSDRSDLHAKILELPYKNNDFVMLVLLPNDKNGIEELEKKLAGSNLAELNRDLRIDMVDLTFPRFKIEETLDLVKPLTQLGFGEIFNEERANFSGIISDPNEHIYVSQVIQKAFIEVNEEGAEAAAATGLHLMKKRSLEIPMEFRADHPFIFILGVKSNTNSEGSFDNGPLFPLFHGKVANILPGDDKMHDEL